MPISRSSRISLPSAFTPPTVRSFLRGPYSLVVMLTPLPAYRGHARVFLKDLEAIRPSAIIDIIHSGESFVLEQSVQKGMKAMREFGRFLHI